VEPRSTGTRRTAAACRWAEPETISNGPVWFGAARFRCLLEGGPRFPRDEICANCPRWQAWESADAAPVSGAIDGDESK